MNYLSCRTTGGWLVVNFETGRLTDPIALSHVENELFGELRDLPKGGKAVICLEELDYTSSQLAGILLGAKKLIASRGGRLVLCRVGEHLAEMLRITRLDTQFEIKPRLRDVIGGTSDPTRIKLRKRELVAATVMANADPEWID